MRVRHPGALLPLASLLLLVLTAVPPTLEAQILPLPFQDEIVIDGLRSPTKIRFAPDGRIFVAEKSGNIRIYDGLDDLTPTLIGDLRPRVSNFVERGLLGLAVDPAFPERPYIYVLYTYDAPPGGMAPIWNDSCPNPPGLFIDGCVTASRLSRLEIDAANRLVGDEKVLLSDGWCQQFSVHGIGTVTFGPDGALYVGSGDGAHFEGADYGQWGGTLPGSPTPRNPCGDPPAGVGGELMPPTAEGGALRSQDLLSPGDPVSFDGAILRLDPDSGEALPDNPLFGAADEGADRVIAFGLRNPYRFAFHPETGELWIADAGALEVEEINRIEDPLDQRIENFGWPCYEGNLPNPDYERLDLDLCEQLYRSPGAVVPPEFSYTHRHPPDPERCGVGFGAAISGLAIYPGGSYPAEYEGALFFADVGRDCVWALLRGAGDELDFGKIVTLVASAESPVDLEIGPKGDLYWIDHAGGAVHRVSADPGYLFADGFESGDLRRWSGQPFLKRK